MTIATEHTADLDDAVSNVKRLGFDMQIARPCPQCGVNCIHDFNEHYISYGDLTEIYFYCEDCGVEWYVPAKYEVYITIQADM